VRKFLTKGIDLAAAMAAAQDRPAQSLTLAELVRAHALVVLDGSDTRLRKWTEAFGATSAWDITPEQLETAAAAMVEHGYKPSAVNRDLSAMGSAYRWAKAKRLCPKGFRSPTLGVTRFEEAIRRVEVAAPQIEALRTRAMSFHDRRFGVFVALLIDTGARKSEILERRWRDFDLEKGEIVCEMTKTGVPRVLHFRDETAALIKRVFARRSSAGRSGASVPAAAPADRHSARNSALDRHHPPAKYHMPGKPRMPDHRPAQAHVNEWLLAALASGPNSASALRETAEAAGYSWRSLQRAAERLQVERTKIGMTDGWMWTLPVPAAEDAISNGIFGARPAFPVVETVTCLAAYGYEVPDDGLMHGVPTRD
jgi:integrase